MPYYRLYLLDKHARIAGGLDLNCESDKSACEEATRLSLGQPWELWRGAERLRCHTDEVSDKV